VGSSRRPWLLRYGAAAALYFAVFAAVFHAVVVHPGSRIAYGFADGTSTLRDYWAASEQHENAFTLTLDRLNGAPEGTPRAPAIALLSGVQTAFVLAFDGPLGRVGAWNLFMLLGILGTGGAMFAFLDRLGCTFGAALFGGLVFGFSPYAIERAFAGHLGLLQNWVLVLLSVVLLRLRARPSAVSALLCGLTIGFSFYLSAYQGLFAGFMALVFFALEVTRPGGESRARAAALGGLSYAVALVSLAPILVLYAHERSSVSALAGHTPSEVAELGASVWSYLLPSPRNPLFHWLRSVHSGDLTEQTIFYGFTTIALAAAALVLVLRRDRWLGETDDRRRATVFSLVLVPAAFVVSLPPHFSSMPMPSWVLSEVTTYWRAYSRFSVLAGFGLAVAAALALTSLGRRPGRGWRLLAPLALVLVALEFLPGNVHALNTSARPPWIAWLAAHPQGIVATYPTWLGQVPALELVNADLWYQTMDRDPAFEIAEGTLLTRDEAIRFLARDLGDPLAAEVLSTEGVRYVVVHDDVYRADGQQLPALDPAHFHLLVRFGQVRIYAVHAAHVDIARALAANRQIITVLEGLGQPTLAYGDGFNTPEPYNGTSGRWMIQNGELEIGNAGPAMDVAVTGVAFSNGGPRMLDLIGRGGRVLARAVVPTYTESLALGPARVPHGNTTLTLVADPGPAGLGPGDPRLASVFLSGLAVAPLPAYSTTP
jgi:hypothetical protein